MYVYIHIIYVCMYVCSSVQHMYTYMRRQIENAVHVWHRIYLCTNIYIFIRRYMYVCVCVYVRLCLCLCLSLSLSLHICVCVCMYIYVFISFICIHIHEWANRKRHTYVISHIFVYNPIYIHINKYTCAYTYINIRSSDLNTWICMALHN